MYAITAVSMLNALDSAARNVLLARYIYISFFFSSSIINLFLIRNHALDPVLMLNVTTHVKNIAYWSPVTITAQKRCAVVIHAMDFAEKYVRQSAHLVLK